MKYRSRGGAGLITAIDARQHMDVAKFMLPIAKMAPRRTLSSAGSKNDGALEVAPLLDRLSRPPLRVRLSRLPRTADSARPNRADT